jgi:hypothetical protein
MLKLVPKTRWTAQEIVLVSLGKCPFCGKLVNAVTGFRDELSRKEFRISGLCQACQDKVFGK